MKRPYLIVAALLLLAVAHAEKKPRSKDLKKSKSGNVQFDFNNLTPAQDHKDSVLIIFDRYNRTGAGVIYQVYTADKDQRIRIEGIPAGKYYVTVKGLGLHRDRVEKIVTIRADKDRRMSIILEDSEEFSKEKVVIPPFTPSFSEMAVLRSN